jgi:hypothetical protein
MIAYSNNQTISTNSGTGTVWITVKYNPIPIPQIAIMENRLHMALLNRQRHLQEINSKPYIPDIYEYIPLPLYNRRQPDHRSLGKKHRKD